ncbi:Protein of unknown function [Pyronema omphalodes CBS 100304]|uniref:Uncharacterized protein n=1 Tax=Pyronema omphalodes (strain CBS 100304) TaxID=1076935 RepID=U4KVC5_PYROM|nr:Protein of unknown function [Pyronema omphalodes CBS 100304]
MAKVIGVVERGSGYNSAAESLEEQEEEAREIREMFEREKEARAQKIEKAKILKMMGPKDFAPHRKESRRDRRG